MILYLYEIEITYSDNDHAIWMYSNKGKKAQKGHYESPVVFQCITHGIHNADKALEKALTNGIVVLNLKKGKVPKNYVVSKLSNIGCKIEKLKWFEKVLDSIHVMCHTMFKQ